ncbi:FAD-dependent monooxygenase [Actinomadura sp. 6N118]|uniref:FAD-dependent monooxygenase n=1 Tax=Actinomadura sp. 6N118 TaxID=3375151 RepID=UPI0037B7649B
MSNQVPVAEPVPKSVPKPDPDPDPDPDSEPDSDSDSDSDPVAVIGAGPVGLTAALLLARWSLPVIVLEREPVRAPEGSRSICQQRDVLDIWASAGASAVAEEGLAWTTARTYYREQELFSWRFADTETLPPCVNISQTRTEEILEECVAARGDLIEVRRGLDVAELEQDARGVTLRCATGEEIRASYVVACSGARSDVLRRALGVSFPGESFDDRFLIVDLRADLGGWEHERRFYFDPPWNPGRQVLIHPCPRSSYRIDWQVPPGFSLAEERANGGLDRRIRQIIGDAPYETSWVSVYRFHSRVADRMGIGRVLLAGDCAHLYAPFGARGLNSGVPDAENAAWKIAFVARGWAPDDLLETYHLERHAAALENLDVTAATMRFLVPQTAAERDRRRAALDRAAADPAMAGEIDSGRFAEPFWYTGSPLTTPEPTRPAPAGRPPKGAPQTLAPGVIVPDTRVRIAGRPEITRLRELLRDGFTLLMDGEDEQLADAARSATAAPVNVVHLKDLGSSAVDMRPGEVWLIRPDAHLAAILPRPGPHDIAAALARATGQSATGKSATGQREIGQRGTGHTHPGGPERAKSPL